MNPDLRAILKEGHIKDEHNYTHETVYPPNKWNIRSAFLTEFWKRYCDLVQDGKPDLCLSEKPSNRAPVILFFNFQFHNNGNLDMETPFNDKFIIHLCATFQHTLFTLMKIPTELHAKTLRTCYLEAPSVVDGEVINCRIRIQFPYCKTDTTIQTKKIIPELIKNLRADNVIGNLDQQPINDWNEIIDRQSVINPIPMIGSTTNTKVKPFYLKYILDIITDTHLDQENLPDLDVGDAFEIKDHDDVNTGIIYPAEFDDMDINSLIPLLLSLHYSTYILLCIS